MKEEEPVPEAVAEFLTKRGLPLWLGSEYFEWYDRGDMTGVERWFVEDGVALPQYGQFEAVARQCGYMAMKQFAPSLLDLPRVLPEIKPGSATSGEPQRHYHGDAGGLLDAIERERERFAAEGRPWPGPLSQKDVHTPESMARHIARVKDDGHAGENTQEIHTVVPERKYLYAKTPRINKPYPHTHDDVPRFQKAEDAASHPQLLARMRHVQGAHKIVVVPSEPHWHWRAEGYLPPHCHGLGCRCGAQHWFELKRDVKAHIAECHTFYPDVVGEHWHDTSVKDPEGDEAQRINLYPCCEADWWGSVEVGLSMEGLAKSLAMWLAGLPCASIGSVSLGGNKDEWAFFSGVYLKDKVLRLCIDADGHENRMVLNHGRMLASYLRDLGDVAEVTLMAPPYNDGEPKDDKGKYAWNGADDYLALSGGGLNDFLVMDKTAPPWVEVYQDMGRWGWRKDRRRRNCRILLRLAEWSDSEHRVQESFKMLAGAMTYRADDGTVGGYSNHTVKEGLIDLVECGYVSADRDLKTKAERFAKDFREKGPDGKRVGVDRRKQAWKRKRDKQSGRMEDNPIITVLAPWRGIEIKATLGDLRNG